MKRIKIALLLIATVALSSLGIVSCNKKDDPKPTTESITFEGKIKLNEGYVTGSGAKYEIWASQGYFVGYNKLYVHLTDSADGSLIDDAHIHFYPDMDMGTMRHGAPTGPTSNRAVNRLFEGSVTFTMPSGTMGSWTLGLAVHNHKNGKEGRIDFPVVVTAPGFARVRNMIAADDSSRIIIALVEPMQPRVGVNDFKLAIYRRANMYSYPALTDLTVEIEPTMPSMGHGSPNNVNPTHDANGIYNGRVNFTMTGDWDVDVRVKRNGNVIATTKFQFLF